MLHTVRNYENWVEAVEKNGWNWKMVKGGCEKLIETMMVLRKIASAHPENQMIFFASKSRTIYRWKSVDLIIITSTSPLSVTFTILKPLGGSSIPNPRNTSKQPTVLRHPDRYQKVVPHSSEQPDTQHTNVVGGLFMFPGHKKPESPHEIYWDSVNTWGEWSSVVWEKMPEDSGMRRCVLTTISEKFLKLNSHPEQPTPLKASWMVSDGFVGVSFVSTWEPTKTMADTQQLNDVCSVSIWGVTPLPW